MSGLKQLKKTEILFREGDPSEAMYVIKSGKVAITKSKGSSEIVLAELGPGDMMGEMAFFDNRPRSAGARALTDCVVIELPFKALNAQFKTFPEWLKAIVRTVNNHLRNANQKIKNLEKSSEEETEFFAPHMITRLMATLGLVAGHFGEKEADGGINVPPGVLRRFTIQVYQLPTAKMQKLMEVLEGFKYLKTEDLGEGRMKITLFNLPFLLDFVEFYNDWLFKSEDKRTTVLEKEIKPLKVLAHYGRSAQPPPFSKIPGEVRVNITHAQTEALKDLGFPFSTDEVAGLAEKKLTSEAMSIEGGLACNFVLADVERIIPFWELIYVLRKIQRD